MARYVLYGNTKTSEIQKESLVNEQTYAFDMSVPDGAYSKAFNTTTVKPFTSSEISYRGGRKSALATTPANVYIDYMLSKGETIDKITANLHKTLNIDYRDTGGNSVTSQKLFSKYTKFYNRFKMPTLNDLFHKGFAHVFFTRPDCNLGVDDDQTFYSSVGNDPKFIYAWKNNADMVKELTLFNGSSHDFMLSLSNKASSFSLNDEYINTDTYGKTFKGWQVAYGRNNVESKTSGEFNVTFTDDRTLHIYNINNLWINYISDVYQGKKSPRAMYIKNRVLDYASSCYYIVTAEDGETIIFWSKYYGIFPTTSPTTQFSWASGNVIERPSFDVRYQYSFKEDMNPESLIEFNINAGITDATENLSYVPIYDSKLGHSGTTWVGTPYIELVTDKGDDRDPDSPYTFKLRFRPSGEMPEIKDETEDDKPQTLSEANNKKGGNK